MGLARAIGLVVAILIGGGLLSCDHKPASTLSLLRRGLNGEPSTLDPASVTDTFSAEVVRDLYEGLTAESPVGDVIPGVASRWEIDQTGTHYTFHLRADAQWSNGKSVTAQDFVSAWRRALDPKQGAADADLLRIVSGASAIIGGLAPASSLGVVADDDFTLTVTLEQPASYFPELLTHPVTFPVYSDASARSHVPQVKLSNGPYVLEQWQPGASLTLGRNPHYWDRIHVAIETVQYYFATDAEGQYRRYRAGELDLTDNVPANELSRLRQQQPQELLIAPLLATAFYGLNLSVQPFANNVKLRQALAMAIDRKRIVSALGVGQTEAYALVAPGTSNYAPQMWDWRTLSDEARLEAARQLYAEAGFSVSSPLRLHVLYNTQPAIRDTAVIIAAMWKEALGIETILDDEEYRVFLETRHDHSKWQVARLSWAADYNDAGNFLSTLRSGSPNDDVGYENPHFDKLLNEAAHTIDPQIRRAQLESAERTMLADYPIIPIYHFVSKRLVKPYVIGAAANPLNHIASRQLVITAH